ncbi:MAG: chromosome partitioning protein ParB [Blastopirellula sp.]|nr:MAG: chromosome partitioning protein ParB [Blastopirellula sp.]
MQLQHIPLDQLKISPLNMRHSRKAPDVSDILPSIRERGIQQPLLVRKNGKGYEIIAGRRRYFSLKKIEQKDKKTDPVPCAIMAEGDDAAAVEASLIENIARCDPDEMTRYETFARLVKEGKTAANIAVTFGVTEIMVRRSLALGNLIPAIRNAYREGGIDNETIRQLTLASKKQQTEWLKLHNAPDEHAPRSWRLKQWLFGGEIKTSSALFPLDTYKGGIITDLFGEDGYFDDAEKFWKLQNQSIATERDALLKAGWDDVVICDVGQHFATWDHVTTSKKDGGRVYIVVLANGEVKKHEGLITQKEHEKRLKRAASPNNDSTDEPSRPELTKAAQNYLDLHRHAAVRHALLSHQGVALRLIVAHAIGGSGLWQTKPDPQRADKEEIAASVGSSKVVTAFAKERQSILKMLGLPAHGHSVVRSNGDDYRVVSLFAALIKLSDKQVMQALTFIMAETLQSGTSVVEALGCHLKVDMADHWKPDEAFFSLLRDKSAINAMLRHIGGKQVADGNVTATAKTQKNIIQDFLKGESRKKVEGWLPHYMQFPFKSYIKGRGGRLSDNLARTKSLIS